MSFRNSKSARYQKITLQKQMNKIIILFLLR